MGDDLEGATCVEGDQSEANVEGFDWYSVLPALTTFFVAGFIGSFAIPSNPVLGFLLTGGCLGLFVWMKDEEDWERLKEDLAEGVGQEQGSEKRSDPKRICKNCGWQNPSENTYCHDCGEELGNVDDESS